MIKLGVNIDHVATVRQARRADEPDPVWAAIEAELGGADNITFHLREDRRHIQDRDAAVLRSTVATKLNMEMAIAPEIVKIAMELKPDQCTLVPERREEVTTEGGLNVSKLRKKLAPVVKRLKAAGIAVSAFIEPDADQISASADCGFDAVEIWTGGYAHARSPEDIETAVVRLIDAVDHGIDAGLVVHAGHGLTYRNVEPVAAIAGFCEFNIGHSICSRAMFVGMREAVREMKSLLLRAEQRSIVDDFAPAPSTRRAAE
ncbi:MAG: pyridoxine 5'-phosphate synthase [Phycisphaerales bacterium]|nr:pyridoxine 5'-phosphate synthase [Phycisphaerales bacterium]